MWEYVSVFAIVPNQASKAIQIPVELPVIRWRSKNGTATGYRIESDAHTKRQTTIRNNTHSRSLFCAVPQSRDNLIYAWYIICKTPIQSRPLKLTGSHWGRTLWEVAHEGRSKIVILKVSLKISTRANRVSISKRAYDRCHGHVRRSEVNCGVSDVYNVVCT